MHSCLLHHAPPTGISTLSLHDALPICRYEFTLRPTRSDPLARFAILFPAKGTVWIDQVSLMPGDAAPGRSEEHTSELQSQSNLVCRLLLEKKNTERGGTGSSRGRSCAG